MKILKDFQGRLIRLTEERLKHILEHPEMEKMVSEIATTLRSPEKVFESLSDAQAHMYYRFYLGTKVGDKFLCVVVKVLPNDAFVITGYLTDTLIRGRMIWPRKL